MSALATFRRAMRRHEKRARGMGLSNVVSVIQARGYSEPLGAFGAWSECDRANARHADPALRVNLRRAAYLYSLAASAVSRLRAAQAEEERSLLYRCNPEEFAEAGEDVVAGFVEGMRYHSPHSPFTPIDLTIDEEAGSPFPDADERAMVATWDEVLP